MIWNHRVLRRLQDGEVSLNIVEVYYDETSGDIEGWTTSETVYGETVEELRQTLHWMLDATEKEILDEAELEATRGDEPVFSRGSERLTMEEVLESLGLEVQDVEPGPKGPGKPEDPREIRPWWDPQQGPKDVGY